MPIRKLIDERVAHLDAQIEAHMDEKVRLIEQLDAFNRDAFAYGDPDSKVNVAFRSSATSSARATPTVSKVAQKVKVAGEPKAARKPRVESGPRRTGLKAEVLQHLTAWDGSASIKDTAIALNAKPQSVRIAIESLLKAGKIASSGTGGYHPVENIMGEAESNMEVAA